MHWTWVTRRSRGRRTLVPLNQVCLTVSKVRQPLVFTWPMQRQPQLRNPWNIPTQFLHLWWTLRRKTVDVHSPRPQRNTWSAPVSILWNMARSSRIRLTGKKTLTHSLSGKHHGLLQWRNQSSTTKQMMMMTVLPRCSPKTRRASGWSHTEVCRTEAPSKIRATWPEQPGVWEAFLPNLWWRMTSTRCSLLKTLRGT